jgi:hypothetical protein
MHELFSNFLIKVMIGRYRAENLPELKLNNLLHILEVGAKEEND